MSEQAGLAFDISLCIWACGKDKHYARVVFSLRKCAISGHLFGQAMEINLLSLLSGPGFTVLFVLHEYCGIIWSRLVMPVSTRQIPL